MLAFTRQHSVWVVVLLVVSWGDCGCCHNQSRRRPRRVSIRRVMAKTTPSQHAVSAYEMASLPGSDLLGRHYSQCDAHAIGGHMRSAAKSVKKFAHVIATFGYRAVGTHKTFAVGGRKYSYFYHYYNNTYANERCVEVYWSCRY